MDSETHANNGRQQKLEQSETVADYLPPFISPMAIIHEISLPKSMHTQKEMKTIICKL